MVKKQAFERAIAVDVPDKTLAEIHTEFESIGGSKCSVFRVFLSYSNYFNFPAIEDEYKGPQLENGKVTLKFMKELMEFYKQEKRLHKKFAYKVNHRTNESILLFFLIQLNFYRLDSMRN